MTRQTVRNGKTLRRHMIADIDDMTGRLREAQKEANFNPRYAELLIDAALGDLERLRTRINEDMLRLLQYAASNDAAASMEQRIAAIEVENECLRTEIEHLKAKIANQGAIVPFNKREKA